MKKKLQQGIILMTIFLLSTILFAQNPPPLGKAKSFVLFTSAGAITCVGTGSKITGDVGSNSGGFSTGFGNINGVMHDGDSSSVSSAFDLNIAFNNIDTITPDTSISVLLGSGQILFPKVYAVPAASTLNGILTLDGQNNPNARFVFQLAGPLSSGAGASIVLINGAKACNVTWLIKGLTSLGAGTVFKGTIVSNAAITFAAGVNLEGRALTKVGLITLTSVMASTPIGCGSPVLTGPMMPNLRSLACYALFTANGAMSNTSASSFIIGDVGSNGGGTVTGFVPGNIIGTLHTVPDTSTAQASTDVILLANYLDSLPYDIELLFPVQFGNSQVLTPHVYRMKAAATLTDTIFFDALGDSDAVFVVRIDGALTSSVNSKVILLGGAKSANLFWIVNSGLVDISTGSTFRGSIVSNPGAITFNVGDSLDGRALSTNGAITVHTVNMKITSVPTVISHIGPLVFCQGDSVILTATSSKSYLWNNGDTTQSITVKSAGVFSVIVTNSCAKSDTSAITTVQVGPSYLINKNAAICNGDSLLLGGQFRKIPGIYTDSLKTVLTSCDSIIRTTLSISSGFSVNNPQPLCPGQSYTINAKIYTLPAIYRDTLVSNGGCDSIIITTITIKPTYLINNPQSICPGGSYVINGNTYTIAATYKDTLATVLGCDSIISTVLTVGTIPPVNNPQTICQGNSYTINGNTYTLAATYKDTLVAFGGCDSIVNTILTVNPTYSINNPQSICAGGSYTFNGNTYTIQATYHDSLLSITGCDSIIHTQLTVNTLPIVDAGTNQTIELGTSVDIGSAAITGNTYLWTPAATLTAANTAQTKATPTVTTTYYLTETTTLTGCFNSDSVVITVTGTYGFYNGFSPNGDGHNDFWDIPVLNLYPSNSVTIINRWGSEVWKKSNYDNNAIVWTGKNMNGDDLPDGNYFYIISYGNITKEGWVFVKR